MIWNYYCVPTTSVSFDLLLWFQFINTPNSTSILKLNENLISDFWDRFCYVLNANCSSFLNRIACIDTATESAIYWRVWKRIPFVISFIVQITLFTYLPQHCGSPSVISCVMLLTISKVSKRNKLNKTNQGHAVTDEGSQPGIIMLFFATILFKTSTRFSPLRAKNG